MEWLQEEASDEEDKITDPMKKHYRCTSCYLIGRQSKHQGRQSMHPLASFGVKDSWQFEQCFLKQGGWTRCTRCSGENSAADHICNICSNKWADRELQVGCHICDVCSTEYPRAHWTLDTIKHHCRGSTKYTVCRVCTDRGCSARYLKLYHCVGCGQYKRARTVRQR